MTKGTDVYKWVQEYFAPNYFVREDVNGNLLHWRQRRYLVDRTSYRVGPARLRQLRSKNSKICHCQFLVYVFMFNYMMNQKSGNIKINSTSVVL